MAHNLAASAQTALSLQSGKYPQASPIPGPDGEARKCDIDECLGRIAECANDPGSCDPECDGYCTAPPA